jgi:hypothetical protein
MDGLTVVLLAFVAFTLAGSGTESPSASASFTVADMGMGELGPELGGAEDDMITNNPGQLPPEPGMVIEDRGTIPREPDMVVDEPGTLPREPDMVVNEPGTLPPEPEMDIERTRDLDSAEDID